MTDIIKRYGALILQAIGPGGVFCYNVPASAENPESVFPLFRKIAEGYDLPEPYGTGLNHMRIWHGYLV